MGISPSLSPQHVLAHLDEFWWMLQSTHWGVSQISSLIDNCTQWDIDLAQLDTNQALMDSPSAYLVYLLGICTPLGWISWFLYISKHISLFQASKSWIEGLAIVIVYWSSCVNKEALEAIPCSACDCVDSQCYAANVVTAFSFQVLCCFHVLASRIRLSQVRV